MSATALIAGVAAGIIVLGLVFIIIVIVALFVQRNKQKVHVTHNHGITTTPNEVYGVNTNAIETAPNAVYGVNISTEPTPSVMYEDIL